MTMPKDISLRLKYVAITLAVIVGLLLAGASLMSDNSGRLSLALVGGSFIGAGLGYHCWLVLNPHGDNARRPLMFGAIAALIFAMAIGGAYYWLSSK